MIEETRKILNKEIIKNPDKGPIIQISTCNLGASSKTSFSMKYKPNWAKPAASKPETSPKKENSSKLDLVINFLLAPKVLSMAD